MKPREMVLLTLPSLAKENERIKSIKLVREGLVFFFLMLSWSCHQNIKKLKKGYSLESTFQHKWGRKEQKDNTVQKWHKGELRKVTGITEARWENVVKENCTAPKRSTTLAHTHK